MGPGVSRTGLSARFLGAPAHDRPLSLLRGDCDLVALAPPPDTDRKNPAPGMDSADLAFPDRQHSVLPVALQCRTTRRNRYGVVGDRFSTGGGHYHR